MIDESTRAAVVVFANIDWRVSSSRESTSHCHITRRERDEERAGREEGGAKSVRREERAYEYVFVCDTRRGRVCMARKERGVEREGRGEGKTRRGRCEIRRRGDKRAGRGEKKGVLV